MIRPKPNYANPTKEVQTRFAEGAAAAPHRWRLVPDAGGLSQDVRELQRFVHCEAVRGLAGDGGQAAGGGCQDAAKGGVDIQEYVMDDHQHCVSTSFWREQLPSCKISSSEQVLVFKASQEAASLVDIPQVQKRRNDKKVTEVSIA